MDNKVDTTSEIASYLFAERNARAYCVLDGASVDDLLDRLYGYEPEFECLYRGELAPDLAEVAPYLVKLDRKSAFTDWVIGEGWGKHWGIFAISKEDLAPMRQHFRRFLTVHDPDGSPMLFRYYDPRVLRIFLPTCNGQELSSIFGPVLCYVMEGEEPNELIRFQLSNGKLDQQSKKLDGEE